MVYVADVTHLEKHLLLLTQLLDLDLPIIMALNMANPREAMGIKVNATKLAEALNIPVLLVSGRTGSNIMKLTLEMKKLLRQTDREKKARKPFYELSAGETQVAKKRSGSTSTKKTPTAPCNLPTTTAGCLFYKKASAPPWAHRGYKKLPSRCAHR